MRANWLCGRFCVQASSFENYIAEKPFRDRFVQQSHPRFIFNPMTLKRKAQSVLQMQLLFRGILHWYRPPIETPDPAVRT